MTTLLTAAQKKTCQSHEHDPAPNGPRANALLALNNGKTQQQAADDSGLSIGQVRYCLRRFRTVSLAIFEAERAAPAASSSNDNETASSAKGKKKSHKKIKKLKPIKSQKNDSEKKTKKKKNDKKIKKKKSDKKDDGKKSSKGTDEEHAILPESLQLSIGVFLADTPSSLGRSRGLSARVSRGQCQCRRASGL